jgi:hypothetical protein
MLVFNLDESKKSRDDLLQKARNHHKKTMNDTFPGWQLKLITKPRKISESSFEENNNNKLDLQGRNVHVSNNSLLPSPK